MKVSAKAITLLENKVLSTHNSLMRWERYYKSDPQNEYFRMQTHTRQQNYSLWLEILEAVK